MQACVATGQKQDGGLLSNAVVLASFAKAAYVGAMPDNDTMTPASRDDLVQALAYGLCFDERGKSHRKAAELAARLAAETLARYLDQAGFVVMKRPAMKLHGPAKGG